MLKSDKRKELERAGARLPRRLVERGLLRKIIPWLKRDEIIVITGARQTGKSVLLFQLIYNLLLPKTNNIFYFNLDSPKQHEFLTDPDNLIRLVSRSKGKTYIFIDEVQRLKEPGLYLKGIYDLHLPVKLIVSGSSALELKSRVHEALTGRKIVFHLTPFDLSELAQALFPDKNLSRLKSDKVRFNTLLEHYFIYGGYPAVALAKSEKIKKALLGEIFQSYIDKDIRAFLKVENETAFSNLIKILAAQIGNLMNKDELSNSLNIHKNTLDNYLFYLEQTFLLDFVRPFYKNPRKELLKNPKMYFSDLGLRNFALGAFSGFEFRSDKGAIFENYFYLALKRAQGEIGTVSFWRTKTGAEVDFVTIQGLNPIPYEVKAANLREPRIGKSLRSFLTLYKPQDAYCINLSLKGKIRIQNSTINFLTPEDWL